ncbi:MAG: hypothetical protein CV080_07930 [Candidatus Kuenenia stuttgartiensis]|nr:MAG: hypothetical protein CV080_07930 [Candidatus Kuenenia stuttgartiensis]
MKNHKSKIMQFSSHSAYPLLNSTPYTPASGGQFMQLLLFSNSGMETSVFNFSKDEIDAKILYTQDAHNL